MDKIKEGITIKLMQLLQSKGVRCRPDDEDMVATRQEILTFLDKNGMRSLAFKMPKAPYRYFSKKDRTLRETEESFCDIGWHRATGDMLRAFQDAHIKEE